jgi:hypothetical protein
MYTKKANPVDLVGFSFCFLDGFFKESVIIGVIRGLALKV